MTGLSARHAVVPSLNCGLLPPRVYVPLAT